MKRYIIPVMMFVLLAAASCREEEVGGQLAREGGIELNVAASGALVAAGQTAGGIEIDAPQPGDFSLTIAGADYNRTWSSVTQYDASERFPAGIYEVSIACGDPAQEGFDKAAFAGSQSVEVLDRNRTTSVELTASVVNSIVEVRTTDNFDSYFSGGATFTLTTRSGSFDPVSEPGRHLFVEAGQSVAVDCSCIRQADAAAGTTTELPVQYIDTRARTRHIITYDLSNAGGATITVTLDDRIVDTVEMEFELNENA